MAKDARPSISLFSGALGLDLGLEQHGFGLSVAVENNPYAVKTIRGNRPKLPVIDRGIEKVKTQHILEKAGLEVGEASVVSAGPCCQAYSTAGARESMGDPRGKLFKHFLRVVEEAQPRFFVMENVRGILSAAVTHRPLNQRGPGNPPLKKSERLGSAFAEIIKALKETGYYVVFDVLNAADYGVPQARERVFIVGSRDAEPFEMPEPTHARDGRGGLKWRTLRQGLRGLKDPDPEFSELPPGKKKYMKLVPEGGNWRDLPERQQADALGKAYESWGGRCGFFRRLEWDKHAPSLTTRPHSKATMICHPEELRPLSIREYARLQGFPDDWEFAGGTGQRYTQIGNAVPVGLGAAVGSAIRDAMRKHRRTEPESAVVCADPVLLERLNSRPTTILNPSRMRKQKGTKQAKAWLKGASSGRGNQFTVLLPEDIDYVSRC